MLSDYEIVSVLSYNLGNGVRVEKIRKNEKFYCLATVPDDNVTLLKRIECRTHSQHPNLLKFYDFFQDNQTKSLYIITEYCTNGNLREIIDKCVKKSQFFTEEFICRILYQILTALKTINEFNGDLNIDEVFLDDDFNVKLYNFSRNPQKFKTVKMYQLAVMLYAMFTLKPHGRKFNEVKKLKIPPCYTNNITFVFNSLLKHNNSYLYKNLDKILCNSTVLLNAAQWKREKSFFMVDEQQHEDFLPPMECYLMEKLKQLRIKEEKLREKEEELIVRERKCAILEQHLALLEKGNQRHNEFQRSKSVRFKGHSPLKEANFDRKRRGKRSIVKRQSFIGKENCSLDIVGSEKSNSSKDLFPVEEKTDLGQQKSMVWTEESKRQAFELLRIMNSAIDGNNQVKHTFL